MINEENIITQITSSATEMFLTKGFKSVTMDDLASNMGMSKKTIYSYFKTKGDLVDVVANYLFDIISTGIDFICAQNHNPIKELFEINDFVLKNLKNEDSSPIYQLQKYYPNIHNRLIKKQFEVAHKCIVSNLINGIKEGLYREGFDTDFVSRLYFLSVTGVKNEELFPKNKFPTFLMMPQYLDYHIRGIATEKGLTILKQIKQNRKQ